jgi:hypothetical protein
MYKLLILFVFLVGVVIYFGDKEEFDVGGNPKSDKTISQVVPIEKVQSGTGKNFINDNLFNDVIYYENDVDIDVPNGQTGLEKCFGACAKTSGTCVEFGITGNAFCFPPYQTVSKTYKDPNSDRIPVELLARS